MRGSIDEKTTSPHVAVATGPDVRLAARAMGPRTERPVAVRRRFSGQVAIGGGLLVAVVIVIVASVLFVSEDSKHPVVHVNPSPSPPVTTAAPSPSPTVAAGPTPPPAATTQQPPVAVAPAPPGVALPQPTAETMTPAPPPRPRHPRLHDLFPNLFPDG